MSPFRASAPFTGAWDHFHLEVSRGVATVTFDRSDRLNALTFEVYADLRDLFGEIPHRDDVSTVVITGRGRGFCSGGDVEEIIGRLLEMDSRSLLEFTRMTGSVVEAIRQAPIPVIAAVNGVAAGAGAVIALASDFRLLARSARFHFLFTRVGLAGADMGSAYLLPRLVGLGRAAELLMLGEPVDPEAAVGMGLAGAVHDDGELLDAATALAHRLATGPTFAYAATKKLLTAEQDMSLSAALELEAMTQALLMTSRDHAEFYRAFQEGREPDWEGR